MQLRLMSGLAAAVLTLAMAPAVNAQGTQPDSASPPAVQPAQPAQPSPAISEQKLDAAAAALQRVAKIQQQYREKLAGTSAASEQQQIIAEADAELTKAVTEQGLSVEEYAAIIKVAQNDADVRNKLLQRIDPNHK